MGHLTFSRTAYTGAKSALTEKGKSSTARGEQKVKETGKLDPLVDPAEFGVVRESRIRFEEQSGGLFKVNVGTPVPIEYRLDTTGSMGSNVEGALKALPSICELTSSVLPGRDPHYCASIFGDICDQFILCRGQFEMLADRMVNQLTLMHPEGQGGDTPEAPYYGIFGATYLTRAYIQHIGMKSFDFTITDAPGRDTLVIDHLKRVFGPQVLEKAKENGHQMNPRDLPSVHEMVQDLRKRVHPFALLVGTGAESYWRKLYGKEHIVILPVIEYVPHVMAVIIGLSEGTLDLQSAVDFLTSSNLQKADARNVVDAVSGIPLGAQRALPNFKRMPNGGDLFAAKTDLWPIDPSKAPATSKKQKTDETKPSGGWL